MKNRIISCHFDPASLDQRLFWKTKGTVVFMLDNKQHSIDLYVSFYTNIRFDHLIRYHHSPKDNIEFFLSEASVNSLLNKMDNAEQIKNEIYQYCLPFIENIAKEVKKMEFGTEIPIINNVTIKKGLYAQVFDFSFSIEGTEGIFMMNIGFNIEEEGVLTWYRGKIKRDSTFIQIPSIYYIEHIFEQCKAIIVKLHPLWRTKMLFFSHTLDDKFHLFKALEDYQVEKKKITFLNE